MCDERTEVTRKRLKPPQARRRTQPPAARASSAQPSPGGSEPTGFRILVLGYGSELRTDDGVGARVVDRVQAWGLPGVDSHSCVQLTPELAETVAAYQRVVFVDAIPAPVSRHPEISRLQPARALGVHTHNSSPQTLLSLASRLFGCLPEAWLLTIPAHSFAFGLSLSARTRRLLPKALDLLRPLLQARSGKDAGQRPATQGQDGGYPVLSAPWSARG